MKTATVLLEKIAQGDFKSLARAITVLENELDGYMEILQGLKPNPDIPIIGVTGPPGAGKSSLINALLKHWTDLNKRIAVVAVDPTSPFNFGSLLGDRLRLSGFFNHPGVFIRSLATRGSLGGLSEKIIEVTDVLRSSAFDYILVETVGVGQSEVEIAGLADTTLVVFVPESGDEIQTMKSGIMEISDIFIINKCDREGADRLAQSVKALLHPHLKSDWKIPVLKTSATMGEGIEQLILEIEKHHAVSQSPEKKIFLLTEKAYRLLQRERMKGISKSELAKEISLKVQNEDFNLYRFVKNIQ